MNLALFAVLNSGKSLARHHDPFALSVRYSLGLATPNDDKCGLVVNGEHYTWRDGDSIIFDQTYLHSAYNHTDQPRIILMTDIDRPLYVDWVQKLYYYFARFFNSLFHVDNVDSSISGVGNRLSAFVVNYKLYMKRLKRRHRTGYMIGKWALHLAPVGLIVLWAL
jgi:beta-hydroxylase